MKTNIKIIISIIVTVIFALTEVVECWTQKRYYSLQYGGKE